MSGDRPKNADVRTPTTYARLHLRDLEKPSPAIYWADLLGSAVAGWGAFAVLCGSRDVATTAIAGAAAVALLYRAHLFIHEISHSASRIKGFSVAWNLTAGLPLLVPSCFAVGVHRLHHSTQIYGTTSDPEYLPFGRSRWLIARFLLLNLMFPCLMIIRFLVLGPAALLVPKLQRHLELHATSLALNPAFIREVGPDVHRTMVGQQLGLLLFWAPLLTLLLTGVWSPRIALCWLVIATAISLTNAIRSLGAHRYLSDGLPLDRAGQHADSIDTPGAWWTILWAPVGHRFHALHHYAPGLPYHNLGAAYRRLARFQESAAPLIDSTSPSLVASLRRLWSTAGASEPRRG